MKLSQLNYIIKYSLWGLLIGFLVLFFMPNSQLTFNWQSTQQAWHYVQKQSQAALLTAKNQQANNQQATIHDISFAGAVNQASPSVVSLTVLRQRLVDDEKLDDGEKLLERGIGIGSGIIVSSRGYIVTNYHVIAESDQIIIKLSDGRNSYAQLVGYDVETDIAVLKTELSHLSPASLATLDEVNVGDLTMAIGSPFGTKQSVSLGIISATDVMVSNPFLPLIQTDAAVNNGNSGGALINLKGQVIGINQKILSSRGGGQTGLNYAIPIERAQKIIDEIILFGKVRRNLLGIESAEFSTEYEHNKRFPQIAFGSGFFVRSVVAGSPADKAGIKPRDFITRYQDHPLTGVSSFYQLFHATPIGELIEFELIRDGNLLNVSVQLEQQNSKLD
jgi:S1-C subfamily serine protease